LLLIPCYFLQIGREVQEETEKGISLREPRGSSYNYGNYGADFRRIATKFPKYPAGEATGLTAVTVFF
jgi:hypothetical protein